MTALDWLIEEWPILVAQIPPQILDQAKQMEKEQIQEAMMYALDEDGHTGDWKLKFVDDYYNKLELEK